MGAYTKKNLKKDVNDSAKDAGMAPNLEGRFATSDLGMEKSAFSYQRLAPNFRLPFGHRHNEQEELYVIVGGSGRMKLGDDIVELERWDAIRVPPETERGVEAGADGLELIAFGAPQVGSSARDDAEQLPGWWDG